MFSKKIFKSFSIVKLSVIIYSLLLIVLFIVTSKLFLDAILESFEYTSYDLRCKLSQNFDSKYADSNISLLAFDSDTTRFINANPKLGLGRWPIERRAWGVINNYFIRSNSQAIVYDILFEGSTNDLSDDYFAQSIKKSKNTYLSVLAPNSGKSFAKVVFNKDINIDKIDDLFTKINFNALKDRHRFETKLERFLKKVKIINYDTKTLTINTNAYTNLTLPIDKFLNQTMNIGLINIIESTDNVIRENPIFVRMSRNNFLLSLPMAVVYDLTLIRPDNLTLDNNTLTFNDKKINLTDNWGLYVNWRKLYSFQKYSFISAYLYEKFYTLDTQSGLNILPEDENYFLQSDVATYYCRYKNINDSLINYYNNYIDLILDETSSIIENRITSLKSGKIIKKDNYFKQFNSPFKAIRQLDIYSLPDNSLFVNLFGENDLYTRMSYILNDKYDYNLAPNKFSTDIFGFDYRKHPFNLDTSSPPINIVQQLEKYSDIIITPDAFTGNIVVMGESLPAGDLHAIPVASVYPGSYIIANVIDNLLNDKTFIEKSPFWLNIIIYLLLIGLSIVILKTFDKNFTIIVVFLLMIIAYIFINLFYFEVFKLWLPLIKPIFLLSLFFIFALISQNLLTREDLKKTYKLATIDGLTGLFNHRYFQEKINNKLQDVKRKEDFFSLLFIDIDFFKKFNDTYGHRAGDAVLIQVGQVLSNSIRTNDVICRYGGEEICIILDKTNLQEAMDIANKLVKTIANTTFYIEEGTKTVNVTISIGVSNFPEHGKVVSELIEFADQCLYRAKEGGRNRVGDLTDILDPQMKDQEYKEIEISKAKIKKELDRIKAFCAEKDLNFDEKLNDILTDYNKPDN